MSGAAVFYCARLCASRRAETRVPDSPPRLWHQVAAIAPSGCGGTTGRLQGLFLHTGTDLPPGGLQTPDQSPPGSWKAVLGCEGPQPVKVPCGAKGNAGKSH